MLAKKCEGRSCTYSLTQYDDISAINIYQYIIALEITMADSSLFVKCISHTRDELVENVGSSGWCDRKRVCGKWNMVSGILLYGSLISIYQLSPG